MSDAANTPDSTTQPSRSTRLLDLVRKLVDFGKEIAATIRQRAFTDPQSVRRCFGTTDAAQILALVSRGLHRANALEARLLRTAGRLNAATRRASSPQRASSPETPRAPRPAAPADGEADARIARLPTPEQIAADVRRRPIGAVIADICRDLGILPSHKLWQELQLVIITEGGNFARLVKDILDRVFPVPATAPARPATPPRQQYSTAASTGPP
jgi:hypothetical protein